MFLPDHVLHVWRADLDVEPQLRAHLRGLLSADELERAGRFRFERDRKRYVAGRGLLRMLLGSYVGRAPSQVSFAYGAHDKPRLAGPGPWFNLSHSGPVALYAFSAAAEVGIDVELDDGDFARERIAEHFFSPAEVRALRSLAPQLQPRAFLACWTRKEAFIKARGDGLSLALDSFDVTLLPGQPAELLRTAWRTDELREWSLTDLSDPQRGFIAAAASRSEGLQVIKRDVAEILGDETGIDQEEG